MSDEHECDLPEAASMGFDAMHDIWTCSVCGKRWSLEYDESYDAESGEEDQYWWWEAVR